MCNFAGSKESEYWSFPLPPISPCVASLTSLVSSADVRDLKSKVGYRDFLPTRSLLCMQLLHVYVPNGWIAWIVLGLLISAVQARTVKNRLLLSSRREILKPVFKAHFWSFLSFRPKWGEGQQGQNIRIWKEYYYVLWCQCVWSLLVVMVMQHKLTYSI